MLNPVNDEASKIAYATGIRELAPLVRRLIALENTVREQATQISGLQITALQLKHSKVQVVNSKEAAIGR